MHSFFSDQGKGQGLAEYAISVALVAIVVIAGVSFFAPAVEERFMPINSSDTTISVGGIPVSLATHEIPVTPTTTPINYPTLAPTLGPTLVPTLVPTLAPTLSPTIAPTLTYQEWCESNGYRWKKNGTCVNGNIVVAP